MLTACIRNKLRFRDVLMDTWFAAQENSEAILAAGKHFVAALKDNRLVVF